MRNSLRIISGVAFALLIGAAFVGCGPTDNSDVNKDVATATPDKPMPAGLRKGTGAGGEAPAPTEGAANQTSTSFD